MKILQALEAQRRGVDGMRGAFSHAAAFTMPCEALHAAQSAVIERMGKAPHWAKAFVRGYAEAQMERLYAESLVFGGYVAGVFYSTHRDRSDYYEKHGIEPREFADNGRVTARGHYWRADTSRPFFIDKPDPVLASALQQAKRESAPGFDPTCVFCRNGEEHEH